jgi:hypothetical protein
MERRPSLLLSFPPGFEVHDLSPHTLVNTTNIGRYPNNAVFHAEMTCLLRAARANGDTLADQTVEVHVDRKMCFSCEKVLPLVGLQLGNPTVRFIDPNGRVRTMRNGNWEPER